MSGKATPKEKLNQAFQSTVAKLVQDMPLLMHGAGDVVPNEVNPDTAALLAALTTHYMEQLVEAAIDAHQMSRDNNTVRKDPHLPARSFPKSLQPPSPPPPEAVFPPYPHNIGDKHTTNKRKRRSIIQYWDEPLPEPKIGDETVNHESPPEDLDTWVGLAGVDFFHDRTRIAYVQAPAALTTQSFIFPLCHDTYIYGRIVEQQAFKQSLEPVLVDRVVMEMVQTEGQQQHARAQKKNKMGANNNKKKQQEKDNSGNASDPEDEDGDLSVDDEEEKDIPTWPGLDSLIPF